MVSVALTQPHVLLPSMPLRSIRHTQASVSLVLHTSVSVQMTSMRWSCSACVINLRGGTLARRVVSARRGIVNVSSALRFARLSRREAWL